MNIIELSPKIRFFEISVKHEYLSAQLVPGYKVSV